MIHLLAHPVTLTSLIGSFTTDGGGKRSRSSADESRPSSSWGWSLFNVWRRSASPWVTLGVKWIQFEAVTRAGGAANLCAARQSLDHFVVYLTRRCKRRNKKKWCKVLCAFLMFWGVIHSRKQWCPWRQIHSPAANLRRGWAQCSTAAQTAVSQLMHSVSTCKRRSR